MTTGSTDLSTSNNEGGNRDYEDWAGTLTNDSVYLSGTGSLDLNHDIGTNHGKLEATGGSLTISGGNITLSSADSVSDAVTLAVNSGATLGIDGGSVVLNGGDNIAGTINATSGTFTVSGGDHNLGSSTIGSAVNFAVTGGTARFDSADNIGNAFSNAGNVYLSGGTLSKNISGAGTTVIADTMTNNATIGQNVNVTAGTLTNTGSVTGTTSISSGATVSNTTGSLSGVTNSGTLNVSGGSTGAVTNNKTLSITGGTVASVNNADAANSAATQSAGTVSGNVTNAGNYTLSGTGVINGIVSNSGTFNLKNDKVTNYQQSAGTLNITDGGSLTLSNTTNTITGGNVQLGEGTGNTAGTLIINNGLTTNAAQISNAGNGASVLTVQGNSTLDLINNSEITSAVALTVASGSTLDISSTKTGTDGVVIDNTDTWAGTVDLTDGTLTILGNNAKTGILDADSGSLNIGSALGAGTLNLNNASDDIASAVVTNIASGSTLAQAAGNVVLGSDDTWDGAVTVGGGNIELNGRADTTTATKTFNQTAGKLTIDNGGSLTLNTSDSVINGTSEVVIGKAGATPTDDTAGTLVINNGSANNQAKVTTAGTNTSNSFGVTGASTVFTTLAGTNLANGSVTVGDGTNTSALNLSNDGIIADAITLTVAKGSKLNVDGATAQATISTGDTWNGDIEQSAGTITHLGSVVKNATDATYKVTGGNVNIGNNTTAGTLTLNNANDSIASAAAVTISSNSKLSQSAGTVALDNNNDTWNGAIELSGTGDLTLDGRTDTTNSATPNPKTFNQSGGTLNLEGSSLNLATSNSKITAGNVNIKTASTLALANGSANTAKVDMSDGTASTLNISGANSELTTSAGTNLATGVINLGDGTTNSKLNLANDGIIAQAAALNIANASELNISDTASAIIDNATDTYAGDVKMTNGSLEMRDLTVSTGATPTSAGGTSPYYSQTGGAMTMTNTKLSMADSSLISGGNLTVDTSSTFNSLSNAFTVDNLTNAGLINGINAGYENYAVNTGFYAGDTLGDKQGDFTADLYARSNANKNYDTYGSDGATIYASDASKQGVLNVSDWTLNGDIFGWDAPLDRNMSMDKLFKGSVAAGHTIDFTSTNKEVFTPIGWYGLHNAGGGNYSFNLNRFNPGVFRGQISKIAQYQNQLMIDDILFSHTMLDQGFKGNDYVASNPNRIASATDLYPPYQYSRKDGGLWLKAYGVFEKLNMNRGLNVGNNAYGTIIGADFGLKDLKHGWQFMPTAYIGYNGAHQYWKGYGAYQNGGQLGVMGTWYKNNFIIGALAYGGVYNNEMDTPRGNDNSLGYFGGGAVKTAYNWRFAKDWSLQPNFLVAYNFFGKENWHSDFGQMGMMSGMLHGINIAPGVNLIWEKETFSIYGTLQYMYNVNQSVGGRAGNVSLPNVHMDRGYIQYGLGVNKRFGDRFSGFLQAVIRNVGRTGVGLQAGFQWQLGK